MFEHCVKDRDMNADTKYNQKVIIMLSETIGYHHYDRNQIFVNEDNLVMT